MRRLFLVVVVLIVAVLAVPAAQAAEVGIVLLPGKGGTSHPKSPIGKLAAKLEGAGVRVALPSVP